MSDDNPWGDDSPSETGQLEREWQSRREGHFNAGYLEGLEEGKQETVQAGFDQGFASGSAAGREWGERAGALLTLSVLAGRGVRPASAPPAPSGLDALVAATTHATLAPRVLPGLLAGAGRDEGFAALADLAARVSLALGPDPAP